MVDDGGQAQASGQRLVVPARDRVVLRGLSGFGRHGVFAFEREQGQRFVADVVCSLDLGPAAASDDLRHTVDYGALAADVVADIEGEPLNLIEALADRIAATCLRRPAVESVEVTVHKPEAPMPVVVADVAVTLTRSKS
jgi:dihydroneopterin aldolase